MATVGGRPGESEYGGKGGIIQRAADGHDYTESASESAMVLRRAGRRDGTDSVVTEALNPDTRMIDIEVVPYSEEAALAYLQEEK